MLYHFEKGWKATESARDINELFGEGTIGERMVQKWFKRFKDGDTSLKDEEGRGRRSDFDDQALLDAVEEDESLTTRIFGTRNRVTVLRLRSSGYGSQVTVPWLRSPGYGFWLRSSGYGHLVTVPWLRFPGYGSLVTVPWLRFSGYGSLLRPPGYVFLVTFLLNVTRRNLATITKEP